jgi:phytoene dehydrogenase-like protein
LGISAYSTVLVPDWMQRLSDFKHCAGLLADKPGERMPALVVVDYSQIDSGLAEGGLYPVNVVGVDRLSNWEGLGHDAYQAKSNAWLDAVIARLEQEWPGLAASVEQRVISTARSMHEHLNAPGGALYGFAPKVPDHLPLSGPPRTPKTSIKGLWLASAYAHGGGFTGAMSAGGAAAKAALREFH